MQLKIIPQNKLKSPKPCFLKIILPFFPAVDGVCVCTLFFLYLIQLHSLSVGGRLQLTSLVCAVQSLGGRAKELQRLFSF